MLMSIFKIVFVIIGTLIGAGFASGQEVYTFFFSFGIKGLIGIVISSISIGLIIYKTLKIIDKYYIRNYKDLLNIIIKNKKVKDVSNIIVNIFILISFYVMIAGFGAYLNQEFGFNEIFGSAFLAIICFGLFSTNIKGFVKINQILIPILILVILIIGALNISNIDFGSLKNDIIVRNNNNWFITSLLYASYNSILLIPALISIRDFIGKSKNIKYISLIVIVITTVLLITIFLFLVNVDIDFNNLQMPAVYAIYKILPNIKNVYGIIILISIFTTAASLGISFLNNVSKNKEYFKFFSIMICLTSIAFSKIGFANLVNKLYPILGILGLIQILQIARFKN